MFCSECNGSGYQEGITLLCDHCNGTGKSGNYVFYTPSNDYPELTRIRQKNKDLEYKETIANLRQQVEELTTAYKAEVLRNKYLEGLVKKESQDFFLWW
jgi:hypothetical protein